MFAVFATDLPFFFPAKDGLPETMRSSAVFRTATEASNFLEEQNSLESLRAVKALTHE